MKLSYLKTIIREEIKNVIKEKEYGGSSPDFPSWSDERCRKYWSSLVKNHPSWNSKVKAVSKFANNPEGFLNTLKKRATGKWTREK